MMRVLQVDTTDKNGKTCKDVGEFIDKFLSDEFFSKFFVNEWYSKG
jgi:hypothetical protein